MAGLQDQARGWEGARWASLPNSPCPSVNNSDSYLANKTLHYAKEATPWPTTSCGWVWVGGGGGGGRQLEPQEK